MTERTDLVAERDFLLRSLEDLDAERDAGNIDDASYASLHEDYTARAASVIRSLRDGSEPAPPAPSGTSRRTKLIAWIGIAVFAGFAAFGLSRALGTREAGETITGNADANESRVDTLQANAEAAPDDYSARIAYARALLGTDLAEALREFDAASRIDPAQPEPHAYVGWIAGLTAGRMDAGEEREVLGQRALASFDQALTLDPNFADAYVFRALTRLNVFDDPAGAVPDFQRFLATAPPDHPERGRVTTALEQAMSAAAGNSTPSTLGAP